MFAKLFLKNPVLFYTKKQDKFITIKLAVSHNSFYQNDLIYIPREILTSVGSSFQASLPNGNY